MAQHVYVLRLLGGRYYVGHSTNLGARLASHFGGRGSSWTKKYAPQAVAERIEGGTTEMEETVTLRYMGKYGIDKVRGGSFCTTALTAAQKGVLSTMVAHQSGACLRCGRSTHWASICTNKTHADGRCLDAKAKRAPSSGAGGKRSRSVTPKSKRKKKTNIKMVVSARAGAWMFTKGAGVGTKRGRKPAAARA